MGYRPGATVIMTVTRGIRVPREPTQTEEQRWNG